MRTEAEVRGMQLVPRKMGERTVSQGNETSSRSCKRQEDCVFPEPQKKHSPADTLVLAP